MITVNQAATKAPVDIFAPQSLVISESQNGAAANIYIVVGPGDQPNLFAGLRLSGRGKFQYCTDILKSAVKRFEGEVVISND